MKGKTLVIARPGPSQRAGAFLQDWTGDKKGLYNGPEDGLFPAHVVRMKALCVLETCVLPVHGPGEQDAYGGAVATCRLARPLAGRERTAVQTSSFFENFLKKVNTCLSTLFL